ncbi:MAG TPA: hypothetical protein DCS66_03580 [Flavobacteriaceae bacterium]|nr:hypothetical protein [Flavobacteriaceae bacterium]
MFQIINIERFSTIDLYDLKGVHLNTFENNNQHSIQLNVSNYPSGIYLLILNSSTNRKQTLKIVIE